MKLLKADVKLNKTLGDEYRPIFDLPRLRRGACFASPAQAKHARGVLAHYIANRAVARNAKQSCGIPQP